MITLYTIRKSGLALVLIVGAVLLIPMTSLSVPLTLVDEDFSGVATHRKKPTSILSAGLEGLAPGLAATESASSLAGISFRTSADKINVKKGKKGFNSQFGEKTEGNNFVTLGDKRGKIGGKSKSGELGIRIPLALPSDAESLVISFDYAFNGKDRSRKEDDIFSVLLTDGSNSEVLLDLSSADKFQKGRFDQVIDLTGLSLSPDSYIVFLLDESSSRRTNTAVGLDNIFLQAHLMETDPIESRFFNASPPYQPGAGQQGTASSIPEPATLILLGSGLAAVLIGQRRKSGRL
jgi:hypothetical protein